MKSSWFKLAFSLAFLTAAAPLLVKSSFAQTLPSGGLYRIISGSYAQDVEVFRVDPPKLALPTQTQSYVELMIDDKSHVVGMTILGSDMQTVFFSLTNGAIFPDHIQFDSSSGNQDVGFSDHYTISNSLMELRIDGMAVQSVGPTALPWTLEHSNVLATLIAPASQPLLSPPRVTTNGVIQFTVVNGRAGENNVLEASTDLITWTPISTNVFPATVGATPPSINLMESPNLTRRFYRSVRLP